MNLSISYLLKFLGTHTLFIIFVLVLNYLLAHKCVILGFIRSQNGYKCFSHFLNHYFLSTDVTFTESPLNFKSSPSPSASPNDQFNIPIVCNPPVVSSAPKDPHLHPTFGVQSLRNSHCPSDDSLLDWYVFSANLYIASSSFLGLDLENLALSINNLV